MAKKKAPTKKVAKKEEEPEVAPPSFEVLALAAARADYSRLQEVVLNEIKAAKAKKIKCPLCKKNVERQSLASYVCPNCPGITYLDESTGLEARTDAGILASEEQINRLTVARDRIALAKSRLPAQ